MRLGRFGLLAGVLLAATLVSDGSLLAQVPGRSVTIKSKRYWADAAAGAIRRSNLDGSGIENVVAGLDAPYGLARDPIAGVLVWTNSGGDGTVQRWNPASGELGTLQSEFAEPYAIVLDGEVRTAYAVVDGSVVKVTEDYEGDSDATEILVPGEPEPLPLTVRRSIVEVERSVEPEEDPVPLIHGLALDLASGVLYIADGYGMMARRVRLTDKQVDALIFEGGPVAVALPGATR
jgi:hypothetical protein